MLKNQLLIAKFKQILSGQYVRNVGWLGGAELANRIFRLGTTVTLARLFSREDYGLMAIIYTTFDFATVFTFRHGIGAKIIQTEQEHLKTISNTSYWLNWMLCGSVFVIQCLAAFPIARFYNDDQLILPLCTVALTYLMMPLFLVNSALIERENRMKITALCHVGRSILSNTIIVLLVFLGMGIWAIVWALVLTQPVWIVITWKNHPWRPPRTFSLEQWKKIIQFGKNLLGVELLNKLRMNLDYLIVGKFLGVEELGMYFFAFNAGSGITTNVVNSFMKALFPYICAVRDDYKQFRKRYFNSLKMVALTIIPIVCLQSALAPIYVPIIFGNKWITAIPILILICLSVIPLAFKWASSTLLNAINKTHISLYFDAVYTLLFTGFLLIAVRGGIFWVALTVFIIQLFFSTSFTVWTMRYVLTKKTK